MISTQHHCPGFTLIELITIILLIGVISVVATARWPGDMREDAAVKEFKRALRYAQHHAMTRQYVPGNAWGLMVDAATNRYTIRNQTGTIVTDFANRNLIEDTTITLSNPGDLWFNGLGEPIDGGGSPLATMQYDIAGSVALTSLFVCPQTGYVVENAGCP
ncbi:MAG: hypothetical protein ABFS09_02360 [Thermodesulfobacteriota bacterium]